MDELASANKGTILHFAKYYIVILLAIVIVFTIGWMLVHGVDRFSQKVVNKQSGGGTFCGGFMGIHCSPGYTCKYDGKYPDAGGECVRLDKVLFDKDK